MKVAIVGAGVSGLCVAHLLRKKDPSLEIEIFERNSTVGGRMSTHRINKNVHVDTGCQFISIDRPDIYELFEECAPKDALQKLPQNILCLPEGFVVDRATRFYVTEGMRRWAEHLAQKISPTVTIHTNAAVESLDPLLARGFDRILVTVPGTEAEKLGAKTAVEYNPCLTITFLWNEPPREALEYYAYRDISSREGITWLAHEGLKSGHPGLWLAQVSPRHAVEWSADEFTGDLFEDIISKDLGEWIPLFDEGEKTFVDKFFWAQAFPIQFGERTQDQAFERIDRPPNARVYYLGDGYRGVGRTENALESALAVANDFFV